MRILSRTFPSVGARDRTVSTRIRDATKRWERGDLGCGSTQITIVASVADEETSLDSCSALQCRNTCC